MTPGVSDALVSLVDFSASFAALTGQTIAAGDAPDSVNVLPALLGESKNGRDKLVEHDGSSIFGFRDGLWKWIQPDLRPRPFYSLLGELYDLGRDLGETNNLGSALPATSQKLSGELEEARQACRRQ